MFWSLYTAFLIYSKSKEEHEEHLCIVLHLWEHQLYTKFSKYDFYKPQIHCLSHIISKKGISFDSKNIKSIEDWPTPTSVTNIRSFFGLAGYYRKLIKKFSRIACPMTSLKKKENKFLWMTNCEESFQKLK